MILYPQMKEPKINEANYTTLLKDISPENLTAIQNKFNEFIGNSDLYDMFMVMYRYYEINDTDESVFLQCVFDTFYEHKAYFKELYDNYTKEYDYATGNKRITSRNDSSESSKTEDISSTDENTRKHYDLPHKDIQDQLINGYIDDVVKNNGGSTSNAESSGSNTYDSVVTTEYKNEFLTLKRQYLNQIRNVNHEFCERFHDCFLSVYS